MFIKTPSEFLAGFKPIPSVQDHHFTGPLPNHQPEGHGSVFHEEGLILATLAYNLGGPVLETGADQGVSTRYIHEGLDARGTPGQIYSVDWLHKWPGSDAPGGDPDWPRRIKIDGDVGEYRCPVKPSWCFCDDDHRYRGVIRAIKTILLSGCTRILFHDAGEHIRKNPDNPSGGSDVRDAVPDYFAGLPGWHVFDISTHCGLFWVINVDKE